MTSSSRKGAPDDVEVSASGRRRRFTVEYKTRIVQEAAQCRAAGEIGSLLRREGLFSSQLTMWRKLYHAGEKILAFLSEFPGLFNVSRSFSSICVSNIPESASIILVSFGEPETKS